MEHLHHGLHGDLELFAHVAGQELLGAGFMGQHPRKPILLTPVADFFGPRTEQLFFSAIDSL